MEPSPTLRSTAIRVAPRPWSRIRHRANCYWEEPMKTQSFYSDSPIQEQESPANIRKRVAIAIVILGVCGLGLWMVIQNALRATSGHS